MTDPISDAEIEAAATQIHHEFGCTITAARIAAKRALEAAAKVRGEWRCKAQRTADPPQDCGWPFCGCDPAADKVLDAIEESGFVLTRFM